MPYMYESLFFHFLQLTLSIINQNLHHVTKKSTKPLSRGSLNMIYMNMRLLCRVNRRFLIGSSTFLGVDQVHISTLLDGIRSRQHAVPFFINGSKF